MRSGWWVESSFVSWWQTCLGEGKVRGKVGLEGGDGVGEWERKVVFRLFWPVARDYRVWRERPYTWIFQAQSDTISTLRHGELLQSGLKGAFSGLHTTEPPRPSITTSNVCDKRVSPYVLLLLFHRGTSVPAEGQTDTPSLNLRSAQHLRQPHRRPRRLRWCPERAPHPIPQPVPNPDVLPDIHWV